MFNHTFFFDEPPDRFIARITLGDGSHIDSTWNGICSNFGHCFLVEELVHSVCPVSQDASLGYITIYTPTQVLVTDAVTGHSIRTGFLMDNRYWFEHQPTPIATPRSHSPTSVVDPPDDSPNNPPSDYSSDDPDFIPPFFVDVTFQ